MVDSTLRTGSLLRTVCLPLLLATHSSAFIPQHPTHPPRPAHCYSAPAASSHRFTRNTRQSDCAIWGSPLPRDAPRVLLKTTRTRTIRRGGESMVAGRGIGTAAFALGTVSSASAAVPMGGPALFAQVRKMAGLWRGTRMSSGSPNGSSSWLRLCHDSSHRHGRGSSAGVSQRGRCRYDEC